MGGGGGMSSKCSELQAELLFKFFFLLYTLQKIIFNVE